MPTVSPAFNLCELFVYFSLKKLLFACERYSFAQRIMDIVRMIVIDDSTWIRKFLHAKKMGGLDRGCRKFLISRGIVVVS